MELRSVGCAGLLCGLLFTAAASSQEPANWKAVQSEALKERKVVLYTQSAASLLERAKAGFERAYPGMVLEYTRVPGAGIVGKVDEEGKTQVDGADIVITTVMLWLEGRAKGASFIPPSGPAAKGWPERFLIGGSAPVLAVEPFVIAYNSNLVKIPITGYADILRPELKGRLGTSEPVAPSVVAWYDWLEKTQGADFLVRFAAQNPRPYTGAIPANQAVASGEIWLTAFSSTSTALPLVEQGAPVKIVLPNPSLGFRYGAGIVKWSKRPNAALVLMDYLTSARGQTAWNGRGESASPLPGIQGSLDMASINPYDESPYTPAAIKTFRDRWTLLFKGK